MVIINGELRIVLLFGRGFNISRKMWVHGSLNKERGDAIGSAVYKKI